MRKIIRELYKFEDKEFKLFNEKIVKTSKKMIGVRTPILKNMAKTISDLSVFMDEYHEEILLHGLVLSRMKDFNLFLENINDFIIKVDNWAVCDMISSSCKIINKNKEQMLEFIDQNIKSNNVWMVRFCFTLLLNYYIDDKYINLVFKYVAEDKNDYYYIMMVKAWLISKCFIYNKVKTMKFLKECNIDNITYNKAIDKICDSFRVTKTDKLVLRKMKKK